MREHFIESNGQFLSVCPSSPRNIEQKDFIFGQQRVILIGYNEFVSSLQICPPFCDYSDYSIC